MNTINQVRKGVAAGLLALSMGAIAVSAQAQTTAAPAAAVQQGRHGHAASLEERQARRAEHVAKRQAKLKEALKITAAQEGAWNTFVAATRPGAPAARGERAAWASLSAPARLEKRIAMQRAHTERMQAHLSALNNFYAVLTPEQKKVLDEAKMGRGGRGGKHGHHQRGMRHG